MSGGAQQTTGTSSPPEWAVPYYQNYLQQSANVAALPYTPYTGDRNAPMNPYQTAGLNAQANRAIQGAPEIGQARDQLAGTLGGSYFGNATINPYGGAYNPNAGTYNPNASVYNQNADTQNPQQNAYNSNANIQNPFAGSNPYLSQMIDQSSQDVVRNYNTAVKPQFDAAMVNSGSFGNSGVQQVGQNAQNDLQKNLADLSNKYRFQDYTTQQGLGEAALQRLYGAGQQQTGNQFTAGENLAARQFGAGAQQAGNIYGSGENLATRLFGAGQQQTQNIAQAGEGYAGRQDSGYQSERGRQMQAIGYAPQLANQDYVDASMLASAGDPFQRYQQSLLDTQYGNFRESQDYPYKQLGTLGSALGQNYGKTVTEPGTSKGAGIIGGAAAGAGMAPLLGTPAWPLALVGALLGGR